jgi:hypothetical protein
MSKKEATISEMRVRNLKIMGVPLTTLKLRLHLQVSLLATTTDRQKHDGTRIGK